MTVGLKTPNAALSDALQNLPFCLDPNWSLAGLSSCAWPGEGKKPFLIISKNVKLDLLH